MTALVNTLWLDTQTCMSCAADIFHRWPDAASLRAPRVGIKAESSMWTGHRFLQKCVHGGETGSRQCFAIWDFIPPTNAEDVAKTSQMEAV